MRFIARGRCAVRFARHRHKERERIVRLWFWGWLVVAVSIAAISAIARDRASAPFAIGAAAAALIEAFHGSPGWEWIAFLGVSSVAFLTLNHTRYRARHADSGAGRHSTSHARTHD
jgi:membrane protein implicated in regulation of membrane protease activity